jgi:hypothetical protein
MGGRAIFYVRSDQFLQVQVFRREDFVDRFILRVGMELWGWNRPATCKWSSDGWQLHRCAFGVRLHAANDDQKDSAAWNSECVDV